MKCTNRKATAAASVLALCTGALAIPPAQAWPARDLARALQTDDVREVEQAEAELDHFEIRDRWSCSEGNVLGSDGFQCHTTLRDTRHPGVNAVIYIAISDRPINFDSVKTQIAAAFDIAQNAYTAVSDKGVAVTVRSKTGEVTGTSSLPGHCLQSLGVRNGPAVCSYLFEPNVVITAVVDPSRAAVATGETPTTLDIDTAGQLALGGNTMLWGAESWLRDAAAAAAARRDVSPAGATPMDADLRQRIRDVIGLATARTPARDVQ